jgi:hypothetical protein
VPSSASSGVEPTDAIGASVLSDALTRARGRHQPYCEGERPQRKYYVSNLAPQHGQREETDIASLRRPSAITLESKPDAETLAVDVEFDVYIPSFPTFEEYRDIAERYQRGATIQHYQSASPDAAEDEEAAADGGAAVAEPGTADTAVADIDDDELYALDTSFYRRVTVETTVDIDLTDPAASAAAATQTVREALNDAIAAALAQEGVVATRSEPDADAFEFGFGDMDEAQYEEVFDTLLTLSADDPSFNWQVTVGVEQRSGDEVALRLMNEPTGNEEDDESPDEPYVFNPRLTYEAPLFSYEFDLMPEDYRFEQEIWAKGRNCSTTVSAVGETADDRTVRRVATTATPTSPVYEFNFNKEFNDKGASFEVLAGKDDERDLIADLWDIETAMGAYHDRWDRDEREKFVAEYGEESPEVKEFDKALDSFKEERDRFRAGIKVLEEEDEDVRKAFKLMNEVNYRVHWDPDEEAGFKNWRLFQLVFIVSNLPSIVARDPDDSFEQYASEYDDMAEVLWFPTGGGKTEAYLGLVIFTLFFDRIRGKTQGVSAWIRFPLRLLSRQQKQRFMTALLVSEDLRTTPEAEGGLGGLGKEFSLGYFPGSQDSPNAIYDNDHEDYQASQQSLEDDCKHLDACPLCGSEVTVRYDAENVRVNHYCAGDKLPEGEECIGRLPFYVVDRDIYRYTPSVLLGSLDKIAVMGMQPRFTNLMGNFTTECPDHGLGYSGRCPVKNLCEEYDDGDDRFIDVEPGTRDDDARHDEERYFDPIPSLHLVDEVHLLNEELGAFASHYESAFLTLCQRISEVRGEPTDEHPRGEVIEEGVTPKVLTSTATVEEYERQIKMLFQQEATRFPEEGPELGETFYGSLDETQVEREYTGMTPNNKTHLYAVLDVVKLYHEVIRDYYDCAPEELAAVVACENGAVDEGTLRSVADLITVSDLASDSLADHETLSERLEDLSTGDLAAEETARRDAALTAVSETRDYYDELVTALDADTIEEVLDLYETSLVYFTNKREKDTYRKNIIKQINDEMREDGYEVPVEEAQLTADTESSDTLPRLEREGEFADAPFDERIDTVPATSFVGHGIDVDRFNFMLFFGYPSQTFQYIQASSRVGRQSGVPGNVLDVFRPFDKRDRHRYKYFEKLHEYLNRTVEPVPIDRWAKFAVNKTFSGVFMGIVLQYYRPYMYRKTEPDGSPMLVDVKKNSGPERINLQSSPHMHEVMDNNDRFPEFQKSEMQKFLNDAYVLDDTPCYVASLQGDILYTNDYFVEEVGDRLDAIWTKWRHELSDMRTPGFPPADEPMMSLRDIGTSCDITGFTNNLDFIEALQRA